MTCKTCGKSYTPDCDWRQGRCPHHPPMLAIDMQIPDHNRGQFYVGLVKSGIRIIAGFCLIAGNLLMAGVCLIFAELVGIVEQMV